MPQLRTAEGSPTGQHQQLPVELTPVEYAAIEVIVSAAASPNQLSAAYRQLARILAPLDTTFQQLHLEGSARLTVRRAILKTVHATSTAYGVWGTAIWTAAARSARYQGCNVLAVAYRLDLIGIADILTFGVMPTPFAWKILGRASVEKELQRVRSYLAAVGYGRKAREHSQLSGALAKLFLLAEVPKLEAISIDLIEEAHRQAPVASGLRAIYSRLSRVLHGMGIIPREIHYVAARDDTLQGIDPTWADWCSRWKATSTVADYTKQTIYYCLLKAGRWLAQDHPEIHSPDDWTREVALEYVVAVNSFVVDQFTTPRAHQSHRPGLPLAASAKDHILEASRVFFRDCQEWGWARRRFDPGRALATPRAIRTLISPRPRVIADDIWARLLWAGLHLEVADLRENGGFGGIAPATLTYPLSMVRGLAITWLFAGLRSNEIARLRVGCVRWQRPDGGPAAAETPGGSAVCLLDVPVHKTGQSYTKPVDSPVGEAIAAWQAERPVQPLQIDPKTGEQVAFLFCFRGRPVGRRYLNNRLIPLLCQKGGVPISDARGRITSHRARATIATQLYNAKEPMSLFELQAWLGHRSPATTQHYARITPTTLTKAYADANYFARNVRAIEVLIDQDAIKSSAAGEPWRYYDLGHGLCAYEFFEQCPHRMACPRCDFYKPKDSSSAQLLDAKSGLLRMLQGMPLTDDERSAVDGDLAALDRLVSRLAEQPTPSGVTPRELSACTKPSTD